MRASYRRTVRRAALPLTDAIEPGLRPQEQRVRRQGRRGQAHLVQAVLRQLHVAVARLDDERVTVLAQQVDPSVGRPGRRRERVARSRRRGPCRSPCRSPRRTPSARRCRSPRTSGRDRRAATTCRPTRADGSRRRRRCRSRRLPARCRRCAPGRTANTGRLFSPCDPVARYRRPLAATGLGVDWPVRPRRRHSSLPRVERVADGVLPADDHELGPQRVLPDEGRGPARRGAPGRQVAIHLPQHLAGLRVDRGGKRLAVVVVEHEHAAVVHDRRRGGAEVQVHRLRVEARVPERRAVEAIGEQADVAEVGVEPLAVGGRASRTRRCSCDAGRRPAVPLWASRSHVSAPVAASKA